jgi:hypothetical protein
MEIIFDGIRKFTVPYLDLTEEELPDTSELKFTSSIRIKSKVLETSIEDGLIVGDNLVMKTKDDKVVFLTEGDIKTVETEVMKEKLSILIGKAKARYPLDYLKKLKFNSDTVDVEFGKDYPMKMTFGNTQVILAPRVTESETDEI